MSNSTTLPKYSNDPNFCGYPLFYVVDGWKCECNECASVSKDEGSTVETGVNYEDGSLYCSTCSEQIEASNGAHEEEDNEDFDRSWQNEIAREAGAMYGMQAYHDHMGYDVGFDSDDCFACDGRGCGRCGH